MSVQARPAKTPPPSSAAIERWREFMRWTDLHADSRWVFRGLGDVACALKPSIGRRSNFSLADEKAVFELFKRRCPEFMAIDAMNTLDLLAIAQHHGTPTRLLDWTSNPLIAAYFAVISDPLPINVKAAVNGRVVAGGKVFKAVPGQSHVAARIVATAVRGPLALKPNDDPFAISEVRFFWPRAVVNRITDQSGLFSVHDRPDEPWTDPLDKAQDVFDIPGEMRAFFRRRLFYLGVHPQRVMGGLDGVGGRLSWQYSRKTGLGTF